MSSSSSKGKAKPKTCPPMSAGKRRLTLEEQISVVSTKIGRHETIVEDCYAEMEELKAKLKKRQRLDAFVSVVTSDACLICSREFSDCIGMPNMALVSYECDCNRLRLVHLGCFTREFKCCCGGQAKLVVKSSSGKDVDVKVSEVVAVSSRDDGLEDSDGDFS